MSLPSLPQSLSIVLAQTPVPSSTATPSPTSSEEVLENIPTTADPCPTDGALCQWILDRTDSSVLAAFLGEWIPKLLVFLVILVAAAMLARLARRLVTGVVSRTASESQDAIRAITRRTPTMSSGLTPEQRAAIDQRRKQRTETLASVTGSVVVATVWLIALIIALGQVGLNVAPLIASAGIIGVALGFGSQSLVKDFLSGIFMLLEDQYGVGDIVDLGEAIGTVEAVTLRVTRLRDVEGTVWHVPNGEVRRVGNLSQLWSRSLLDIAVGYDSDLDHAGAVISRVANELATDPEFDEAILEEPELWGVEQFGPDAVILRLVMKVQPAAQWKVNREFRARIKRAFDEEGIEIPFPQRTLWVRQEGDPVAGIPQSAYPEIRGDDADEQGQPEPEPDTAK